MKQNKTVIGLVGGSGSGKSYVGDFFTKNGCFVIDADKVARNVVEKGEPALNEIVSYFGDAVIDKEGNLIRKELAKIVFSDKDKLNTLNDITLKYISDRMVQMTQNAEENIVVWDAPTLFEANMQDKCNYIVCVIAPKNLRIQRIMERDNLTRDEAVDRIKSQKSDDFLINNSDYVIENDDYPIEDVVENILFEIKADIC